MADLPKPDARVIAAYLDEVSEELDVVRRLLDPPPRRFASFHLQQAAEKLVKAVRLHRGMPATADHNLEALIDELPAGDPWRDRLAQYEELSAYATAYRYPTPTGKRKPGLDPVRLLQIVTSLEALVVRARQELLGTA
jgi:HEPN domain-containing protein